MRSRFHLTGSMAGLIVAAVLVVIAAWVWQVCAVHAKVHGHDGPASLFNVEAPHDADADARWKTKDCSGGHGGNAARCEGPRT